MSGLWHEADSTSLREFRAEAPFVLSGTLLAHVSFDHVVGACEQGGRHGEAECFRRVEIDNQLKFGRLLNRQIGSLVPPRILST
jgi:hypothetical protein